MGQAEKEWFKVPVSGWWIDPRGKRAHVIVRQKDEAVSVHWADGSYTSAYIDTFKTWVGWGWKLQED